MIYHKLSKNKAVPVYESSCVFSNKNIEKTIYYKLCKNKAVLHMHFQVSRL